MSKKTGKAEEAIRKASRLQLSILDLCRMRVCEEDIEILSGIGASALQILLLSQNKLTCRTIATLPQARWPILKQLNLGSNKIGNKGVKYVVMTSLPQLQTLILDQNIIDDAGMKMLIKGKWDKLTGLYLSDNKIYVGLQHVVKGHWKELKILHISHLMLNADIEPLFDLTYMMLAETKRLKNVAFDVQLQHAERIEQRLLRKFKKMRVQSLLIY